MHPCQVARSLLRTPKREASKMYDFYSRLKWIINFQYLNKGQATDEHGTDYTFRAFLSLGASPSQLRLFALFHRHFSGVQGVSNTTTHL